MFVVYCRVLGFALIVGGVLSVCIDVNGNPPTAGACWNGAVIPGGKTACTTTIAPFGCEATGNCELVDAAIPCSKINGKARTCKCLPDVDKAGKDICVCDCFQ
jgi:hypothetical protein